MGGKLLRKVLWLAMVAALPSTAAAHVRWFVPEWLQLQPPDFGLIVGWPTLAVIGASLGLFLLLRQVQRLVGGPHWPNPPLLAYMEPCATALLAVHTGISLVWFAYQGNLFVPQLVLPPNLPGWLLVALQIFVAFTFITGLFDRAGALLLMVTFLLGFLFFPPLAMLGQLHYVGIGLALFVLGRTVPPEWVARKLAWVSRYETEAVAALRILTGLSLVAAAFDEKLLAPELGRAFLAQYPHFNFMRSLFGFGWFDDDLFVTAAGITEATIGILLITGVLTRAVILGMWVPFNLTVPLLPPVELLGHLPIFGIMYVLLLYGSGVPPRAAVRLLEPAVRGEIEEARRRLRA